MKKRSLALLLVLVMMLSVMMPAVGLAGPEEQGTTENVTLHKILMSSNDAFNAKWTQEEIENLKQNDMYKEENAKFNPEFKSAVDALTVDSPRWPSYFGLDGTFYQGEKITDYSQYFGETQIDGKTINSKEIAGVYFEMRDKDDKLVTVTVDSEGKYEFGTADAYTEDSKTLDDANGTYVVNTTYIMAGKTSENGIKFPTKGLKGEYVIKEVHDKSSYHGAGGEELTDYKAVPVEITLPLVNKDGVVADAHVYPKNIENKPQIDKNFAKDYVTKNGGDVSVLEDTNELANAGADYTNYESEKATIATEIGKQIDYEVKTQIPAQSKYKTLKWSDTMSKGLTYKKGSLIVKLGDEVLVKDDYTVEETLSGFVLKLTDTCLENKINNKADLQEITLTYSAYLNSVAVVDKPEENDIYLDYGNNPDKDSTPKDVEVEKTELKVNKKWAEGTTAPAGTKVIFDLYEKIGEDYKLVDTKEYTTKEENEGFFVVFEELKVNTTYRVIERSNGYVATYLDGGVVEEQNVVNVTNEEGPNDKPLHPTTPKVQTYEKKFVKTNQDGTEKLANAQFVVKNGENQYLALKTDEEQSLARAKLKTAEDAYKNAIARLEVLINKAELTPEETTEKGRLEGDGDGSIKSLFEAYEKAFKEDYTGYKWVADKKDAYKFVSNDKGQIKVTGLAKGTYYLEEIKAPDGYAKLTEDVKFTVGITGESAVADDIKYEPASGKDDAIQIKNKKVSIPQTGGIGTIVFTVAGLAIMATAMISLKKRRSEAK